MKDTRDIKKTAFLELRDLGHTFAEIKKILNVSPRTLYYWQNEQADTEPVGVPPEDTVTKNEFEDLQNQVDNLSTYYQNLWKDITCPRQETQPMLNDIVKQVSIDMLTSDTRKLDNLLAYNRQLVSKILKAKKLRQC